MEAHGRGQDQRDGGRLTLARQTFLTCAQSACPTLVQADCARFGEELDRIVPTVSFAARDTSGGDLPDALVYVDDQPTPVRLDDGKSYDLDPGRHTVRFVYDGRETKVSVVLSQGEKGRNVIATFGDGAGVSRSTQQASAPAAAEARLPAGPLFVVGLGAAAAIAGGVLVVAGLKEVPSSCSLGSRQCVAPPADPSISDAHRGVTLANFGLGLGVGGAAVLAGGTIWYIMQPARIPTKELGRRPSVTPWFGSRSGGLSMTGRF
ncbi:MAG TPA: hypothetical protein VH137_04005 [Gemmatimonadales bacterium]|nr:hypothetical protein [Gemmatimonadales bacterium]